MLDVSRKIVAIQARQVANTLLSQNVTTCQIGLSGSAIHTRNVLTYILVAFHCNGHPVH